LSNKVSEWLGGKEKSRRDRFPKSYSHTTQVSVWGVRGEAVGTGQPMQQRACPRHRYPHRVKDITLQQHHL